jgi:hypothetical protein
MGRETCAAGARSVSARGFQQLTVIAHHVKKCDSGTGFG